jgi:hypothetical protein
MKLLILKLKDLRYIEGKNKCFSYNQGRLVYLFLLLFLLLLLCLLLHSFANTLFCLFNIMTTVSVSHGFGLMNADRMVMAAESWTTVPDKIICVGETQLVNEYVFRVK